MKRSGGLADVRPGSEGKGNNMSDGERHKDGSGWLLITEFGLLDVRGRKRTTKTTVDGVQWPGPIFHFQRTYR